MTEKQANEYLYNQWENGYLPKNFTEEHSQYDDAIKFVKKNGYYYINAEL